MTKVLIAFDNHVENDVRNLFMTCAEVAQKISSSMGASYTMVDSNSLDEAHVCGGMADNDVCVIAAHGTVDSIQNNLNEEIISKKTTNYNLEGKCLYTVACLAGQVLGEFLVRHNLKLFVGYEKEFRFVENEDMQLFAQPALAGLTSLLRGENKDAIKSTIINAYRTAINNCTDIHPFAKPSLVYDMESLVVFDSIDFT